VPGVVAGHHRPRQHKKHHHMEYRTLGRSGLRISTLVLGTMTFGGRGKFSDVGATQVDEAASIVKTAVDAGVNMIDTADVYSGGRSEEIVGQILPSYGEDLLVATKVRFPMGAGPNDAGLSRHHIVRAAEASLRRLGRDHIDLYQVHEWDGITPVEETLDALDTLVHQGKVRYVGCSNYAAWQLMKALGASDRLGLQRFVSQQVYCSLLGRELEQELIPAAIDQGLGVLVWSPLAGGLLSGKYRRGHDGPAGARHTTEWSEPPVHDWDRTYDIIDAVVEVAEGLGVSGAQVALAWLLGRPAVTGLVIGARTEEQLTDNLAAVDLVLPADERAKLDAASVEPLAYPFWHQAMTAADRLGPADRTLLDQAR
jgi:aryl-alcohol dehydrogenase-like predicted oxidoreductase